MTEQPRPSNIPPEAHCPALDAPVNLQVDIGPLRLSQRQLVSFAFTEVLPEEQPPTTQADHTGEQTVRKAPGECQFWKLMREARREPGIRARGTCEGCNRNIAFMSTENQLFLGLRWKRWKRNI